MHRVPENSPTPPSAGPKRLNAVCGHAKNDLSKQTQGGGTMSGKVKHVARVIYYGLGAVLGITLCMCAFLVYFVVSVDPETGIRTDGLGRTLDMPRIAASATSGGRAAAAR